MNKVARIKFRNKKKKDSGFEIITLSSFVEATSNSVLKKQYRTDFYNLIFVTEGVGTHEIDFLEYNIEAGECLIISKNRVHRYSDYDDLEGFLIMFTDDFIYKFLGDHTTEVTNLFKQTYLNPQMNFADINNSTLISLLGVIHEMYTNDAGGIDDEVIASTFRALVLLISNISIGDTSKQKNNEIFIQFSELVESHIDKEKTVEGYANMMHVSKKTVNLMTRKAIDMSAKQYIIQQLVLRIKLNLCFEQKSINEIANALGFSESSNMTKFFKKYTGGTPRQFRSVNRENDNIKK